MVLVLSDIIYHKNSPCKNRLIKTLQPMDYLAETAYDLFLTDQDSNSLLKSFFNSILPNEHLSKFLDSLDTFSTSPTCDRIFLSGDIIYHCLTCTDDETCVLCSDCFNKEMHRNHEYSYYISSGIGGCCDCGDKESWNVDINCLNHKVKYIDDADLHEQNFIENYYNNFSNFFTEILIDTLLFPEDLWKLNGDTFNVVIFNDEKHSFVDVSEAIVNADNSIDRSAAETFSENIDKKGYMVVFSSQDIVKCRKFQKTISSHTLECVICDNYSIIKASLISISILFFYKLSISGNAKKIELVYNSFSNTNFKLLRILLLSQHLLWKESRKYLDIILTKLVIHSSVWKINIGVVIVDLFLVLLDNYVSEKREPHLTIFNIIVQVFSSPSVMEALLCSFHYAERMLNTFIYTLLNSSFLSSHKDKGYRIAIQGLSYCFSLVNEKTIGKVTLSSKSHDLILSILLKIEKQIPLYKRKCDDSDFFESDSWISWLNFVLSLMRLLWQMSKFCFFDKTFMSVLVSLLSKVLNFNDPFYPAIRPSLCFLGLLIKNACFDAVDFDNNCLKLIIPKCFDIILFHSQVSSGLWSKNGISISYLSKLLCGPQFKALTIEPIHKIVQSFSDYIIYELTSLVSRSFHGDLNYIFDLTAMYIVSLLKVKRFNSTEELENYVCVQYLSFGHKSIEELQNMIPFPYCDTLYKTLSRLYTNPDASSLKYFEFPIKYLTVYDPLNHIFSRTERYESVKYMSSKYNFDLLSLICKNEPFQKSQISLDLHFIQKLLLLTKTTLDDSALFDIIILCVLLKKTFVINFDDLPDECALFFEQLYSKQTLTFFKPLLDFILEKKHKHDTSIRFKERCKLQKMKIRRIFSEQQRCFEEVIIKSKDTENLSEGLTCVYCKDLLDVNSEKISGIFVRLDASNMLHINSLPVSGFYISSCEHYIHFDCYNCLNTAAFDYRCCPVCNKLSACLINSTIIYSKNTSINVDGLLLESYIYTFLCNIAAKKTSKAFNTVEKLILANFDLICSSIKFRDTLISPVILLVAEKIMVRKSLLKADSLSNIIFGILHETAFSIKLNQNMLFFEPEYDELYLKHYKRACCKCGCEPKEPIICVQCSEVFCFHSCSMHTFSMINCLDHLKKCFSGVFLLLKKAKLLFFHKKKCWVIRSIYSYKYGAFQSFDESRLPSLLNKSYLGSFIDDFQTHSIIDRVVSEPDSFVNFPEL